MVEFFQRDVFVYIIVFLGITVYLYVFSGFFEIHAWWILLVFLFVVLFLVNDLNLRINEENKSCRVKDTRESRIDFWK